MIRKKQKKYIFTDEEKQHIRKLKKELSTMGIPREQWSNYIQQELTMRKQKRLSTNLFSERSGSTGFFGAIGGKVGKIFRRFISKRLSKRFGQNGDYFENLFDGFKSPFDGAYDDDLSLMNTLFPATDLKPPKDPGKHGTFVADRLDKKSMIISFDEEDDDK